jgi:hypothetical protein
LEFIREPLAHVWRRRLVADASSSVAALAPPTNGFAVGAVAPCVLTPLDPTLAIRTRGVPDELLGRLQRLRA